MRLGVRGALGSAVLLAALAAVPAGADSSPSPTPAPEDPIRVLVTQILPRSPSPNGAVEVDGVLQNIGTAPVTDLRVRLQVGDHIGTRSELEQADQDRPPTSPRVSAAPLLTRLASGQRTQFRVLTTSQQLGLERLGVYPLDVVARGNAGDGIDSLGLSATWLPYFAGLDPRPIRVAVAWPLVDVPHLKADGTLPEGDDLATLLAPRGRLGRLLDAARTAQVPSCERAPTAPNHKPGVRPKRCEPVPVTIAVDPDLLDAAQVLAGSKRPGADVAATWLDELRSLGLAGRLLALPYADPDVSALARDARTKDDIATAQALSDEVVTQVLDTSPDESVAWPPSGAVTPAAADALALSGARAFVLDPSAYEDTGRQLRATPSAASIFTTSATGAELTGLVIDPVLSDLLTTSGPDGTRVTEQRFLAETAIVAAQLPGESRTLVLAPDRRANVPDAAAEELRDLGRVPWLCPVSLTAVGAGTESCNRESGPPAPPLDRGSLSTDMSGQLAPRYLRAVAADRDAATQLTDAVVSPAAALRNDVAALKGRLRRAVARAESSVGRDDPKVDRAAAAQLHTEVQRLTGEVVVRGGRSLLTSSNGTLSVSLENTLPLPVQVRVRFTSKTATLTNAETGLVTVQSGHAVQASVHAKAQRSGQFVVFAQLVDRDGKAFGPETEIIVRSTRFGGVALAVTIAAAAVLLVAAGFRIVRRIKADPA